MKEVVRESLELQNKKEPMLLKPVVANLPPVLIRKDEERVAKGIGVFGHKQLKLSFSSFLETGKFMTRSVVRERPEQKEDLRVGQSPVFSRSPLHNHSSFISSLNASVNTADPH